MASGSAHVVVLAFPQAGHTNPILQFSKHLASQGVLITFVSFAFDHQRLLKAEKTLQSLGIRLRFESIPDHLPPGMDIVSDVLYIFSHLQHLQGSDLEDLIQRLNVTGPPVTLEKWNKREQDSKDVVVIPAIGELRMADSPSTVESFNGASWVILNTFDELEGKAIKYLREANVVVCTVGPLIPRLLCYYS